MGSYTIVPSSQINIISKIDWFHVFHHIPHSRSFNRFNGHDGQELPHFQTHLPRDPRISAIQVTWECNPGTGNAPPFLQHLVVTHWKSLALQSRWKRSWHRPSSPPNRPRKDLWCPFASGNICRWIWWILRNDIQKLSKHVENMSKRGAEGVQDDLYLEETHWFFAKGNRIHRLHRNSSHPFILQVDI